MVTTTAACVAPQAPVVDPMEVMSFACIQAVEMRTNSHDVVVLGADPRSGTWELDVLVGGTGLWSCAVSQDGVVEGLDFLGSDGSPRA